MSNFSTIQKDFVSQAAQKSLRMDGRGIAAQRPVHIVFGKRPGEVELRLGNANSSTIVIGRIDAKITTPRKYRDREGFLRFSVDLTAMKQNQQKSALYAPKRLSIEISQILDKTIIESKAVDRNSLSILVGKYVWDLNVEIILINNAGNLIDACYLTCLLALMSFKLPLIKVVEGEKLHICNIGERKVFQSISIHHIPIMVTIVFKMSKANDYIYFIDPLVRFCQ